LKEREELASKSAFNSLKHKFDIVNREKEHVEKGEKMMKDNYKRAEEKIMLLRKDIHIEKRKNEVLSRRILEMEKSLSAMSEDIFDGGHPRSNLPSHKQSVVESDTALPHLNHSP
jgi:chromosome segregation ATPase